MAVKDVDPDAEPTFTDVDAQTEYGNADVAAEDDTEVVAHAGDSVEDTPWCVGYLC